MPLSLTCSNTNCLEKNEYTAVKPAFCSYCGTPFDAAFKRVAPAFVTPTSTTAQPQPYAQQPRPHVGQYHQPYPYQPGLNDIVLQASDIQLDPNSVRVESEHSQKLTVGDVAKGGGGSFGGRPARDAGVNPEGSNGKKFDHFRDEAFANMRKGVPAQPAQPRTESRPAQSRSSRSRKKTS